MPNIDDNSKLSDFVAGIIVVVVLFTILIVVLVATNDGTDNDGDENFTTPSGGINAPAKYIGTTSLSSVSCDSYEMNLPNSICKCPSGNKPDYDNYFSKFDKGTLNSSDKDLEIKIYNNYTHPLYILHTIDGGSSNGVIIDKFTIKSKHIYILNNFSDPKNDHSLRSAAQRIYVYMSKPPNWKKLVKGSISPLGQKDGAGLIEFDGTGNGGTSIAFDISHVDYTTIPIYMVARDKNHKRFIESNNCTSPMIYSGANCSNKDMVKGCPTEVKNVNHMDMCLAPIGPCQKYEDGTIPSYCHDLDPVLNLFPNFTDKYVNQQLGMDGGAQHFLYGNLSGKVGLPGTKEMGESNHPFIYRPLISGIMTGRCSLNSIKDGSCVGSTAIGCQDNGGNSNIYPILSSYRDSYKDSHSLNPTQLMTAGVNTSNCDCNPPKSGASDCWCNYGFCQPGITTDWNDTDIVTNNHPYNKYAKWSASHGNGRFYSYPFDDTRGTIIPGKPMMYLDIVLFPHCGKHTK